MVEILREANRVCAVSNRGRHRTYLPGNKGPFVERATKVVAVIEYEKMVEEAYPGRAAVGICQYDMSKFPTHVLDSTLKLHRSHVFQPHTDSNHSSMGLGFGECRAEIVADRFVLNPAYYYVVQQRFPQEIVGWGVAADFDTAAGDAERLARTTMQ